MNNSLLVYNFLTTNPIEIVAQVLTAKFGLSKAIITIIIVFFIIMHLLNEQVEHLEMEMLV